MNVAFEQEVWELDERKNTRSGTITPGTCCCDIYREAGFFASQMTDRDSANRMSSLVCSFRGDKGEHDESGQGIAHKMHVQFVPVIDRDRSDHLPVGAISLLRGSTRDAMWACFWNCGPLSMVRSRSWGSRWWLVRGSSVRALRVSP